MSVRAKFKCTTLLPLLTIEGRGGEVRLHPVISGSPENDSFFQATPSGQIVLSIINKVAFDQFEVGEEYYVDFSPAEQPASQPDLQPEVAPGG